MIKLSLPFLLFLSYSISLSDDLGLSNGYVIENVQFVDSLDGMMRFAGQDITISLSTAQLASRQHEEINPTQPAKIYIYNKKRYENFLAQNPIVPDNKTLQNVVTQHGETIRGSVYEEQDADVIFLTEYGQVSISKDLIVQPIFEKRTTPSKYPLAITMVNGESFNGALLSSTDSTVTYQTSVGIVTVVKKDVLSITSNPKGPIRQSPSRNSERRVNTITVKEYNSLPLLIFTAAGVTGAILWFKDASDYSSASNAFTALGLTAAAADANTKSNTDIYLGVGASIASLAFLLIAVTPTEQYINQPVTIIPTSNGIRLAVQF
jgi:hypothetical protein